MKIYTAFAFLLAVIGCTIVIPAAAQHYSLDTTFNYKGIDTFEGNVATGIIHRPRFVLPQVDNQKIVIVGNIWYATSTEVMRLNYDGTLDTTFNDSGKVVTTLSYIQTGPSAAILYDTSKILTAAAWLDISTGWEYMAIYNYNSNGTLNTAFGTGGIAKVGLATPVYTLPISLGAQTDGKFVALGSTADPASGFNQYGLLRLLPSGAVDATFGSGGRIIDPYPVLATPHATGSVVGAMAICGQMQTGNKFIVTGMFADSLAKYAGNQLFVVRHNTDGSPDYTFGEGGGMTLIKDSATSYEVVAMDMDGAGNMYFFAKFYRWALPAMPYNCVVVKLDHNGHRVSSYGTNGVQYLDVQLAGTANWRIAVQKDGRVIIPGIYHTYTPGYMDRFGVIRLDTSGNFDTTFNPGGFGAFTRDSTGRDLCISAGVQPDGKILLVGWDTLSATSICMRLTNYNNPLPHNTTQVQPATQNTFTSHLFPNPAYNREVHIRYCNTGTAATAKLELYDAGGRRLDTRSELLMKGDGDMNYSIPSALPVGTYYVVLHSSSGQTQVHPVTILH